MPFSYYLRRDLDRRDPVFRPQPAQPAAYAAALAAEARSVSGDLQDRTVDSVFFSGGYLGLLAPDRFETLMTVLSRRLKLAPDAEISGWLFPGCLDRALLDAYRNANVGPLMFEIPSLLPEECEKLRLPDTRSALEETVRVMEQEGFSNYGLRVLTGISGRTKSAWERIAGELLRYRPAHLEFTPLDPDAEDGPGFDACLKRLEDQGYRAYAPGCRTRAEKAPRYPAYREEGAEYLGLGLAAESRLDGFWSKNTGDPNLYLRDSFDYQKIIAAAREL